MAESIIQLVADASDLPRYSRSEITIIPKPECPDKENYMMDDGENEPYLDKDEFGEAMGSYTGCTQSHLSFFKIGNFKEVISMPS